MLNKSKEKVPKLIIKLILMIYFTISFSACTKTIPNYEHPIPDTTRIPTRINKTIEFKGKGEKESKVICTQVDPKTQCEIQVPCQTGEKVETKTLAEVLGVDKAIVDIENHACATFSLDLGHQKNPYYCSGGFCRWSPSDRRLKNNIHKIGQLKNGLNIYKFKYIWDDAWRVGVMADEVRKVLPEAVITINGYDLVDYSKIKIDYSAITDDQ